MITQTRPGRYGEFGGQYLPETLMPAVAELEAAWLEARADRVFTDELARLLRDWVGRPLPSILLVLLLIATFWHASLGLQVVIEDYVHTDLAKLGLLIVVRLACFGLAVAGIFAVLSIALGTTA